MISTRAEFHSTRQRGVGSHNKISKDRERDGVNNTGDVYFGRGRTH